LCIFNFFSFNFIRASGEGSFVAEPSHRILTFPHTRAGRPPFSLAEVSLSVPEARYSIFKVRVYTFIIIKGLTNKG
jgi:hypothetical protein